MVTKDQVATYLPAQKTLAYGHATSPHAVTELTTGDGVVKFYAYDANGNLLQRIVGGTMDNFEWDQDNRLLRMRQGSSSALREFVYDYTGERVKASSASSGLFYTPSRDFDWDGYGSANLYVFLGSTRVATFGLAFTPPPVSGGVSVDWESLGRGLGALGLGLWPFLAMLLGLALTRWWLDPKRASVPVLAKRVGVGVLVLAILHATAGPAQAIAPPYAGHWNLTLYYHADYKGSTSVVYDAQRNGQQGLDYWPYGAVRGNLNNGYVDVRHKFTGQELDNFLGLYYYGGRWYDPETGRFISPDPFVQAPKNPQSLNRYSYVINNPTNLTDPTGYFLDFIIAAAVTVASIYSWYQDIKAGIESSKRGKGFFRGYFRSYAAHAAATAAGFVVGGPIGGAIGGPIGGFVGAVAGGAAAGLASAAVMGGDLGQGALWGAGTAAALYVVTAVAMKVGEHLSSVSEGGSPDIPQAGPGESTLEIVHTDTSSVPIFEHDYNLLTGPEGQQFALRGGPTKNWGSSQAASGAVSNSGDFGTIHVEAKDFNKDFTDFDAKITGRQTVLVTNQPYSKLVAGLKQYALKVNEAQIRYRPWSANSNSVAYQAPTVLGAPRPPARFLSPGSGTVLPVR